MKIERFLAAALLLAAASAQDAWSAVDFHATTLDGREIRLSEMDAPPYTLVFLYNSDCDYCEKAAAGIRDSEMVGRMTEAGTLRVVSVAVFEEGDSWKKKASSFPEAWLRCLDSRDEIIDGAGGLDFTTVPVYFLLDGRGEVVCRTGRISDVEAWIDWSLRNPPEGR